MIIIKTNTIVRDLKRIDKMKINCNVCLRTAFTNLKSETEN